MRQRQIKKPEAMHTIKLKTYNMKSIITSNEFFLLSKGYNAGKPLETPCPNCFIITSDDHIDKSSLFWICYSLWRSGKYLPLLCGSVVPFLHINDIRHEIQRAIEIVNT